jgi:DNA-binding LacI/PurR family transcriptional regulator
LVGVQVVTIQDVAREAKVAVATVSRVMNNTGQVRAETRERVMAAVEQLGYRTHRNARALARGRMATVAVLVPFVTHPSAFARVQGMVEGFRARGLPVSLFDVEAPAEQGEHIAALAGDLRPEGLVIVSLHPTPDEYAALAEVGLRPVLVDTEAAGLSSICIDDEAGGRLATSHLLQLGHERVAFVGDVEDDQFGFTSSQRRHRGFVRALAEAGVSRRVEFERLDRHGRDTAQAQAFALFDLPEPPTAVFAASDTQALGVLEAAAERGLAVPGDLSVVGFDDVEAAAYAGLTTVHQPLVESGRQAARIVRAELDEPERQPERHTLPIHLVQRRTTGAPRVRRRRSDKPGRVGSTQGTASRSEKGPRP